MNLSATDQQLSSYVEQHSARLIEILQDLVRIPSENTPPQGSEGECQKYIAGFLSKLGCDPVVYGMDEVPGLKEHPLFLSGRDYANRPNVEGRLKGAGNNRGAGQARSLLLTGHIDTVPIGAAPWTKGAFSGLVEGNRLYGRGANDMKGGVATNLFIMECLRKLNLPLAGDVLFEAVIDEEFGGVNGTLAGRLKGFNADAVVLSEPSFLRICPAQQGGRIAHITLKASGGILNEGPPAPSVIEQLTFLLAKIPEFAEQRRRSAKPHPLYANSANPVPVTVTKIFTAPWGMKEPIAVPSECKVELYWQAMPGEKGEDIDREFLDWMGSLPKLPGSPLEPQPPEIVFPGRWLPGSAIAKDAPLVTELADCATRILGKLPAIAGMEAPCDMFVFHDVQHTPAVLWGARGGNTHAADEYVEIDTLVDAAKVLLVFAAQWCSGS
ncbi:MAG TPA: M20/M25/M40 family metallo-hydrolase [Acidobacteriaceae bacterium]|nr:M20/M25/M40 family metallo-hydrolase [Acidobacteriaceae bacterium]